LKQVYQQTEPSKPDANMPTNSLNPVIYSIPLNSQQQEMHAQPPRSIQTIRTSQVWNLIYVTITTPLQHMLIV